MKKALLSLLVLCIVVVSCPIVGTSIVVSDFNVVPTGASPNFEYRFGDQALDIKSAGKYVISNIDSKKPTQDRIEISASEGKVELVLNNVNIDVSSKRDCAAIKISDRCNAEIEINIIGNNYLKSGENCAGLQKDGGRQLIINSENNKHNLTAQGGYCAAGIGGGNGKNVDNIYIIGGHIIAQGGLAKTIQQKGRDGKNINVTWAPECTAGAGIGGGGLGSATDIYILGNAVVDAHGGHHAAGIGGGRRGSVGNICIGENSVVNSTGGHRGAGVGAGMEGHVDGIIAIQDNAKVVAIGKGKNASGIGHGDDAPMLGRCIVADDSQLTATGASGEKNKNGEIVGGGYGICCLGLEISDRASIFSQGYVSGNAFSVVPVFKDYKDLQVFAGEKSPGVIITEPVEKTYTESKYVSIQSVAKSGRSSATPGKVEPLKPNKSATPPTNAKTPQSSKQVTPKETDKPKTVPVHSKSSKPGKPVVPQKSEPLEVIDGYVGIKNGSGICSLNSALQILYHDDVFREYILRVRVDRTRQPYLSKLKEQFEKMQAGILDFPTFDRSQLEFLKQKNRKDGKPVNYSFSVDEIDYDIVEELDEELIETFMDSIEWAQTRLLNECLEEFEIVEDPGSVEFLRRHFDYNYLNFLDPSSGENKQPIFVKMVRNGEDLTSVDAIQYTLSTCPYIPETVNLCCRNHGRRLNFDADEIITVSAPNGERFFQLDKIVIWTGGHFYAYVRGSRTNGWAVLNDSASVRFVDKPDFTQQPIQYVYNEIK